MSHTNQEARRELDETLQRLRHKYPDLRLTQLIGNAVPPPEATRRGNDLYYVTDEDLLGWLRQYEAKIDELRRERQGDQHA